MFKSTLTAIALVVAAGTSPVLAGPATTVSIPIEAEDLHDPARRQALEARIAAAAEQVCRDRLLGDLLRPVMLRDCIADTTATALADLEQVQARLSQSAELDPPVDR